MTTPLRILLVDDEQPARDLLREYLEELPEALVVGECSNGFEAVKAISSLEPDLVLLDIQMPKLNGFEVLELLDRQPAVIFTTAYDEFALRAFEVHAVDYLLKPFAPDRLREAFGFNKKSKKDKKKGGEDADEKEALADGADDKE